MTDRTAYQILRELAENLPFEDQELREALEAGATALAAFVRITQELEHAPC